MSPGHDIITSDGDDVTCACGWEGTRRAHAVHFRAPEAAEGIAAARRALEGKP